VIRQIGTAIRRDHLKPLLLPFAAGSPASTLTHPARSSGAASVSDISTVPSAATVRWSPERV